MRGKIIALLLCISVMGTMNPVCVRAEEAALPIDFEDEIEVDETEVDEIERDENATGEIGADEFTVGEITVDEEYEIANNLPAPSRVAISSVQDLCALRDDLDDSGNTEAKTKEYYLCANIDMSGIDWVMPKNSPVSFDGNGYTISNMNIKFGDETERIGVGGYHCYGMFHKTDVSNLTLNNTTININRNDAYMICGTMIGTGDASACHITGNTKFIYRGVRKEEHLIMGGIVGAASQYTSEIKGCTVDGTLDFTDVNYAWPIAGGVVGTIICTYGVENVNIDIDGCNTKDSCVIKSTNKVGGIIGENSTGASRNWVVTIKNCKNRASISGTEIAGIAYVQAARDKDELKIVIDNCENYRSFDFEGRDVVVCGIATAANDISNCVNYGTIKTGMTACGIVRHVEYNGSVTGCVNKGDITAIRGASGIANDVSSCDVSECYNTGNITSMYSASGVIDSYTLYRGTDSQINKCFNRGNIKGDGAAGLVRYVTPRGEDYIVGVPSNFSLTVSDCFNCGIVCPATNSGSFTTGLIESVNYSAGGDGRSNDLSVSLERCYNVGAVGESGYINTDTGNQIVRYLIPYYLSNTVAATQKFEETDCFYLNDSDSRAMPRRDTYNMGVCQIDERPLSEGDLKNAYLSYSVTWANGKAGYEFPYLRGVGESDLPTNFSHSRQKEELARLMQSSVAREETDVNMYPDKNGRVINFKATTLDSDGNRVPVYIDDFIDYPKSDANKDKLVLKSAKNMKLLGYTFKGWFTTIKGKEKKVTKLALSKLDDDVTLTAKYVVNQIKVGYKVTKPAKGVKTTGKLKGKKYKFTQSFELAGNEITAPGYRLIGWTRDKNNTTVAEYRVGDNVAVSELLTKGKSVTLYSVWEAVGAE